MRGIRGVGPVVALLWAGVPAVQGADRPNVLYIFTDQQHAGMMGWLFRDAGYETAYGGKTHVPGKIEDYGFDVITADQREELASACATFLAGPRDRPFLLVASFINPHDICYMAINDFERARSGKGRGKQAKGDAQECLAKALARPDGVSEDDFWSKHCPPAPANPEPQAGAPDAIGAAAFAGFRGHAFQNWSAEQWRLHRWAYRTLTERVDREIGSVLAALRDAGLDEKTLVVLSSDHGDMDGSHRLEHKSVFYEEAARVPFIVSLKGVTKAGAVDREHVVSGRYKYCIYASGDRREQLVDLEKDPGEMRNVAGAPEYAEVLAGHRRLMGEWVAANGDTIAAAYIIR